MMLMCSPFLMLIAALITTLLSPSKCLLALLMQECSRMEILAYRACVGVGVTGT